MTLHCKRPDRDVFGLVCGYPLPCPHHTVILEPDKGTVLLPRDVDVTRGKLNRLREINEALEEKK